VQARAHAAADAVQARAHAAADAAKHEQQPFRSAGADTVADFCAAVRAAVRAMADSSKGSPDSESTVDSAAAADSAADGKSSSVNTSNAQRLDEFVQQLSKGEGALFNHVDQSHIRAGYVGCAMCGREFHETDEYEGRQEVKVLSCFHSICGTCLQTALANGEDGLACPVCRVNHKKLALHEYLPHFEAHSMIDSEKIAQSAFSCEECILGTRAEAYCEDCQMHMCSACVKQHQRAKASARHAVVKLRQDSGGSRLQFVHRAQYCAIHRSERYELYCEDCDLLVCHRCVVERHQNHSYKLPSASLVDRQRARIQSVVENLCGQLLDAQSMHQWMVSRLEAAEARAEQVRQEVCAAFDQLVLAAINRNKELTDELCEEHAARLRTLDAEKSECSRTLVHIWRTIDFLEKTITHGTDMEVLKVKAQLHKLHQRQLQQWDKFSLRPVPDMAKKCQVAVGWRSTSEFDNTLHVLSNFGELQGVGQTSKRNGLPSRDGGETRGGEAPPVDASKKKKGDPLYVAPRRSWADLASEADKSDLLMSEWGAE